MHKISRSPGLRLEGVAYNATTHAIAEFRGRSPGKRRENGGQRKGSGNGKEGREGKRNDGEKGKEGRGPVAAPAIDKVGPRPYHCNSGPTTGPTTQPGSQNVNT